MKRRLGRPPWTRSLPGDLPSHLAAPQFNAVSLAVFPDEFGAPAQFDIALMLSGPGLCLLYYEGEQSTVEAAFSIADFARAWAAEPNTREALCNDALARCPPTLWLEPTSAVIEFIERGASWRLRQRNGVLLSRARRLAPRIRNRDP